LQVQVKDYLQKNLPDNVLAFVNAQIQLNQRRPKGRRYNTDLKLFALAVYHLSGSAYKILSKLFTLPSQSCLSRWMQCFNLEPGLNNEAIEALKVKVASMKESDRIYMHVVHG